MEVSLAQWLEALERPDLETLLRRRPEARSLFSAKRCDLPALAEAISRPEAVLAAAESLDGFLLNLLHAAILLNPDASASSLSALAPGVDPQELAAGPGSCRGGGLPLSSPTMSPAQVPLALLGRRAMDRQGCRGQRATDPGVRSGAR